ncbi:non-ribosomal peptide synthetase [Thauera sp. Sel9]|uniref:non-ribosomal peptide synthetase n=1 Tax=Thauera sp. Sel9 TaxID=2974299 RepID=UPI0021E15128|nr:amino acid adenylation domain-containing protein [Thauera sp. Sel9]MCV2218522.1 amino acid adenylation domain-containing protein [Thauera sp. Sel9]
MDFAQTKQELARHGIGLTIEDGELVLRGRIAELPPSLLNALREAKPRLLASANADGAPPWQAASNGQARLAYLDLLQPQSAAYIVAAALVLRGEVELEPLRRAWQTVIERRAMLRAVLAWNDGQPGVRFVSEAMPLAEPLDLRRITPTEAINRLAAVRQDIATRGFDLEAAPPWRALLVLRSEETLELMLAAHHFIADGWSIAHALRELARLYRLECENAGAAAAAKLAPARPYSDFAAWQRDAVSSSTGMAALSEWGDQLRGLHGALRLRGARPYPPNRTDRGARIAFSLEAKQTARLRAFAASRRVTVALLLAAVHGVLLARQSGATRFALGIAVSQRPDPLDTEAFGFYVNWLPVVVDLTGIASFTEFLPRFAALRREALAAQDIPFDAIVRASGAPTRLDHHPIFQHMVVSHVPARRVDFGPAAHASISPLDTRTSKLDLTLFVTDCREALPIAGEGEIYLEFEYSLDVFDASVIEALTGEWRKTLTRLLDDPDAPLFEQSRVESRAHQPPQDICRMLDVSARRHATATAIVARTREVTYAALWRGAQACAEMLAREGVTSGSRVALLCRRVPELLSAYIGILRIGAVVVPLDIGLPKLRIREQLEDSEPALVLGRGDDLAALCPECEFQRQPWPELQDGEAMPPTVAAQATTDGAYLLYTSGSSGRPKGILGSRRALGNFVAWLNQELVAGPGQRVLARAPFGFDASLRETVAPLAAGATIVLSDDEEASDPEALLALMHDFGVTTLHATPSVHALFLEALACAPAPATLHTVMCGGESLKPTLARLHCERLPHVALYNVYGPTECTVDVSAIRVDEWLRERDSAGLTTDALPIGQPISGAVVYVADERGVPVSDGAQGEIVIGGCALSLGYWREGRATGFPVASDGPYRGTFLYRTGDQGRRDPDGLLWCDGRADRQLKILGARVEPAELERVLCAQAGVADAAVIASTQPSGIPRMLAFVAVADAAAFDESALRESIAATLPRYLWPAGLFRVSSFPRLPNGKRDDSALLRLATIPAEECSAPAASLTSAEQEVAALMGELLGRTIDDAATNFFHAGGHSLDAARLLARLRQRLGVTLRLRELVSDASVTGIAARVEEQRRRLEPEPSVPPLVPSRRPRASHD